MNNSITVFGLRWVDLSLDEHNAEYRQMFTDYCAETLHQTGDMLGTPFDVWLSVAFIVDVHEMEPVGFLSIDPGREAVEVVYVAPAHRRRGAAAQALSVIRPYMPFELKAKGPFTPSGHELVKSVGMRQRPMDAAYLENLNSQGTKNFYRQMFRRICKHKQGRPGIACMKCVVKVTEKVVDGYWSNCRDRYTTATAAHEIPEGIMLPNGALLTPQQ